MPGLGLGLGLGVGRSGGAGAVATPSPPAQSDWLLATNYYEASAVDTLAIAFPKADSITGSLALNRVWPQTGDMRIPIVVRGGVPPFKFTIDDGVTDGTATIQEILAESTRDGVTVLDPWHANNAEYGWLTITNPGSGTKTFKVDVEDQLGATDNVTWTTTFDDDKFKWVDPAATDDTGAGTKADPYKTTRPTVGGGFSGTHNVCYKAGISTLRGSVGDGGYYDIHDDGCRGHLADPAAGSNVEVHMDTGWFRCNNVDDAYLFGFDLIKHTVQINTDAKFFNVTNDSDRFLVINNNMGDYLAAPTGNDGIMSSNETGNGYHDCVYSYNNHVGVCGSTAHLYSHVRFTAVMNDFSNITASTSWGGSTNGWFEFKAGAYSPCVRFSRFVSDVVGSTIKPFVATRPQTATARIPTKADSQVEYYFSEIDESYNLINAPDCVNAEFLNAQTLNLDTATYLAEEYWKRRNNYYGDMNIGVTPATGTYDPTNWGLERNAYQGTSATAHSGFTNTDNVGTDTGEGYTTVLDATTGFLVDSGGDTARTDNIGLVGCEIKAEYR